MSDKSHILVIDDEKNYLLVLQTLLEDEGYTVTAISDPETALAFLAESEVDVVVTDMKMPKVSGREVLQHVKKSWPYIPVLIMTAFGSIESAVEAMKYGAFDYITKPFSNDELLLSIHNATELARAHRQYRLLQEAMEERYSVHQIVGRSRAIRDVLVMVDRAAPSRSTVLITGESGTGKELVANAIWRYSPRSPSITPARARKSPSSRSTAWPSTPGCWRASSSAMRRAPSPVPWPCGAAASSRPTAARSFWTRSPS